MNRPALKLLPCLIGLALCGSPAEASGATPARTFGVYVDAAHVGEWSASVGASPQMVAKFESFSLNRTIDDYLGAAKQQGMSRVLVSWEPWKPVPTSLGPLAQSYPQAGFRNRDIVRGVQDTYIRRFARSLARFKGVVYLRYAHEMNGTWYPWSRDPRQYPRAWRHIVRVFRSVGARNVRFVWSVNPNLYESRRVWLRNVRRYWPGAAYVDYVGSTMINFGGERKKTYLVRRFAPRFRDLRREYRKPVMLTEVNTDYTGRVQWLRNLRQMLRSMPWVRSVVWSQLTSRGQALNKGVGELNWDVQRDPAAAGVLRAIIRDGLRRR
ncbi:MAG: glycoside hydrolase family 26 protein [Thermoleophilaceae bacterium]